MAAKVGDSDSMSIEAGGIEVGVGAREYLSLLVISGYFISLV